MKKGKNQAQRLMNPLLKINESLKKGKKMKRSAPNLMKLSDLIEISHMNL
jgi:hypothetical protein